MFYVENLEVEENERQKILKESVQFLGKVSPQKRRHCLATLLHRNMEVQTA